MKKIVNVFDVGDLCADQEKRLYVILEINEDVYTFMHLSDYTIESHNPLKPLIEFKKGTTATQPFYEFEKYHYLYQIK